MSDHNSNQKLSPPSSPLKSKKLSSSPTQPELTKTDSNINVPLSGIKLSYINEIINYIGGRYELQNKSTRQVFQRILELTKNTQNSFCEMLESNDQLNDAVGDANVFISHAWDYQFLEVVDILQDYFRKDEDDDKETIIWFDIFSKNQHKAVDLDFNYWSTNFKEAIQKFGRTVMVLSPWNDPVPLTRAWCLWELYCTVITESKFEIAMTNESKQQFIEDILKDPEGGVNKMLSNIDVERSEATVVEDIHHIFEAIYQDGGFSRLNKLIFERLREWVIDTMKEERTLPDNFSNPVYINSLALLYQHQGSYEEAQPLFEECLTYYQEKFVENHPQTLTAMNNLGRLYINQGDFHNAIFHLEKCLQLRKEILGEEHPDTITTMSNLGMVYMNQHHYDLAEPYFQKCYDLRKNIQGSNHPDTLRSMEHLGRLYLFQGRDDEAKRILNKYVAIQLKLSTKNHPDTLATTNQLGMFRHYLGDSKRALENLSYSVEWQIQKLGENHPNTLRSMNNLGIFYMNTDRIKDAQLLLLDCYELRSKSLGEYHPQTLDTKNNIKELISKVEEIYDAFPPDFKDVNEESLEISNTVFEIDQPKKINEFQEKISTLETSLINKENENQELTLKIKQLHKINSNFECCDKNFVKSSTSLNNTQFLSKENFLIREKITEANKNELLQFIKEKKIVNFLGTGVTLLSTNEQNNRILSWSGLLDELKKQILGMWFRDDDESFFNNWENQNEFEKATTLRNFSESHFVHDFRNFALRMYTSFGANKEKGVGEHTPILTALSSFRFPVLTTNYDYLLELELNRNHLNMNPSSSYRRSIENHHEYIFHIHGILHEANNIFPDENLFSEFDILTKKERFFPDKSILFVGCQFGAFDSHFTRYYKEHPHLKHFLLLSNEEYDDLANHPDYYHKFRLYLERGTINPIIYGDSCEDFEPFIWNLLFESGVHHIPIPINRDIQPHVDRGNQRVERDYDGEKRISTRKFYPSFSQFNQIFSSIFSFKNLFPKIFQLFTKCTLSMSVVISLKWISENFWKIEK